MIGLSHVALAGALAACLAAGAGYFHGLDAGASREIAAQQKQAAAVAAATQKLQAQLDAAGASAATAEIARQTQVREIRHETQRIIERPVYRNVCVDADGVRLLDRAAATANGRPDQPAPAGPAAGTAEGATQS